MFIDTSNFLNNDVLFSACFARTICINYDDYCNNKYILITKYILVYNLTMACLLYR